MHLLPGITFSGPLKLPVEIIKVDGLPKVLAGNLPITPVNVALKAKRDERGATDVSLEPYAHASRLYAIFAAHRARSLIDVTNEDFRWFVQALKGGYFTDASGQLLGNGQC